MKTTLFVLVIVANIVWLPLGFVSGGLRVIECFLCGDPSVDVFFDELLLPINVYYESFGEGTLAICTSFG